MKKVPIRKKSPDLFEQTILKNMETNREERRFLLPRLKKIVTSIFLILDTIPEFRQESKVKYPLNYLLSLILLGLLVGQNDCENVVKFLGQNWQKVTALIGFDYGLPSEDELCKILTRLKEQELRRCLKEWLKNFHKLREGSQVAVDGTVPKASKNKILNMSALYVHNVVEVTTGLVLDALEIPKKTNEKTASLELLKELDLNDVVVTTDALNTTGQIMRLITEKGGSFVLPVKANLRKTAENIQETFKVFENKDERPSPLDFYQTYEKNGGRKERRDYTFCSVVPTYVKKNYPQVKAVGKVVRRVEEKVLDRRKNCYVDKVSYSVHYVVLSGPMTARQMASYVRGHWKVESFHWSKDNFLLEDKSTNRKGHARINFALLRRIAYNLLVLLENLVDEISKQSTMIEKRSFLCSNLHLAVQLIFGWDEHWQERLSDYLQQEIEDLKTKEEVPEWFVFD